MIKEQMTLNNKKAEFMHFKAQLKAR